MKLRYQPALDGFRAVAVLAVIFFHANYGWVRGGFLGVDAFFVLSGFLITTLLLDEHRRSHSIALVRFWGRRLRRLLPALLLVLLVVAAYAASSVSTYELSRVRGDAFSSLFYVTNWRFILTDNSYFDLLRTASPVQHLWSLAIEEQFYLVWPLAVLGCLRVGRGRHRVLVAVALAGVAASTAVMAGLFDRVDVSRAYYGTDARAHTILVGALLAILLVHRPPHARRAQRAVQGVGVAGAVCVVAAMHATSGQSARYYRGGSLLFAVAVAAVIAAVMQERSALRRGLAIAPLVWIGTISYGLYLWHWPINLYVTEARVGVHGVALDGLRLALTFACATASYYALEMPIRRGALTGIAARVSAPVAVGIAGVALVAATAGATPVPTYLGGAQSVPVARTVPAPRPRPQPVGHAAAPVTALPVSARGPGTALNIRPYPCPPPSDAERSDVQQALRASALPLSVPARGPIRVLVVGDSVACSVALGLEPAGRPALIVQQAAVLGCGVVSGEIWADDEGFPSSTAGCREVVDRHIADAVTSFRPDVVVWVSTWERLNLVVNDQLLETGTRAWRTELDGRFDAMLAVLGAHGARVVVTTVAAPAPTGVLGGGRVTGPQYDWRFGAMNNELRAFATRHPSQALLVDVARKLCRTGPPCPAHVDGAEPRRLDGAHFDPAGSVWLARWLTPAIIAIASPAP